MGKTSKIPIKNIKGQSGAQSPPTLSQLSGLLSNLNPSALSSIQQYAPGVTSLLQNNLSLIQNATQQQGGNAQSGNILGMNWQVANLPFDTKLLVTQVPRVESNTTTEQFQETPLNYKDLIENQEKIKKINEQLEQINNQRYSDYLSQLNEIQSGNRIFRGLDENNSNVFQKSFAPLTRAGGISYGYDFWGGLMPVRGTPAPPQFEKPIELKEIGKVYSGTKTSTKSGVDYSTQILQSGTTSSSPSSSPGSKKQKEYFNVQTVDGTVKKLGTDIYLKGLAQDAFSKDINTSSQSFINTSNSVLKSAFNDPDFDLMQSNSKDRISNLINLKFKNGFGKDVDLSFVNNTATDGLHLLQEMIGRRLESEYDPQLKKWSPTAISLIRSLFNNSQLSPTDVEKILAKASQAAGQSSSQRGIYFIGSLFEQLRNIYKQNPTQMYTGIWNFSESLAGRLFTTNKIRDIWNKFANKYEGMDQYKTAGADDLPIYLVATAFVNKGK